MKKIITVFLCVLFVFSFAACSQNSGNNASADEATQKPIIQNNITDSDQMMTVESEIGTLNYPKKWEGKVSFESDKDKVEAFSGKVKLFSVYFGGQNGLLYGTLHLDSGDKELRYEMYDIDSKSENAEDLFSMQEDINVIFQYLIEEGKLTANI